MAGGCLTTPHVKPQRQLRTLKSLQRYYAIYQLKLFINHMVLTKDKTVTPDKSLITSIF